MQHLWRQRIRRAERLGRFLRLVPFVRLVGLNGSLVTGRMRPDSDIDFYVATAPGRLYLTRLLVTLVVHLTGWRRYGRKIRGRVCLNRFAAVTALSITPPNLYHARVFSRLVPLWAWGDAYRRYLVANRWMAAFGWPVVRYRPRPLARNPLSFIRQLGEWLLGGWWGDRLEAVLGRWQRARIAADPRTHEPGSRVIVRADELCFHAVKRHG